MVWCSQGTTESAGNHRLSVLEFHDGMVLTGHHRGRLQGSPIHCSLLCWGANQGVLIRTLIVP